MEADADADARALNLFRTLQHMTRDVVVRYSVSCEFLLFIPLFCAFLLQACSPAPLLQEG
jgi:hypothetical protein